MVSWVTPVRGVQLVLAIILLGLSGWLVAHTLNTFDAANFNVFTAVWTILVCAYFIATGFLTDSVISNTIIGLAVDGLTWIFWLAAFASIAAKVHDIIDESSTFDGTLKATIAFGVIEWILFSATLVWNGLTGFRGGKSSGAPGPGV